MDTVMPPPTAEELAQINFYLEELRRLNAEIAAQRTEGERLTAGTRAAYPSPNALMEHIDSILSPAGAK